MLWFLRSVCFSRFDLSSLGTLTTSLLSLQEETFEENGGQDKPPGFHFIPFPFMDDMREPPAKVKGETVAILEGSSRLASTSFFECFPSDDPCRSLLFYPQPRKGTSSSCPRSSQSSREDLTNQRTSQTPVSLLRLPSPLPFLSSRRADDDSRNVLPVLARHYAHLEALAFDGAWDQTEAEKVEDKSAPLWESMHDVSSGPPFFPPSPQLAR